MPKIPPYSLEFRSEAVRLLRSSGRSVPQLARELGVSPQSLRNWSVQLDVDEGKAEGLSSAERDELRRLRRENRVLAEERGPSSPRKAGPGERLPVHRRGGTPAHSIAIMCRVLEVSRSGYHAWTQRPVGPRAREDARLTERIRELHQKRRGVYGSPRIWSDLTVDDGERIGRKRVERLMRQAGLSGLIVKKWRTTTIRVPGVRVAERSSRPQLRIRRPEPLLGRRHHLPAYLGGVAVPRRRSRPVQPPHRRLGDGRPPPRRARHRRTADGARPPPARSGLIWHSDQGSQFVSLAFGQKARAAGIAQSMGSKGDCFDNAVAESFFATLKKELINRRTWPSKAELRTEVFDYIEVFYNRERRHSTLGQRSPADYEKINQPNALEEQAA